MFKVYDLLEFFKNKINEDFANGVEVLNRKDDLMKVGNKIRVFMQYGGIDYKNGKAGSGVVKVVFYVIGKRVYNTKDDNIPKVLDNLRDTIYKLNLPINEKSKFGYMTDFPLLLEEKFNNTDTLEFIYSLVVGIPIII